ncbi:hypothetical protein ILYODFUR_013210, partial [Ilyodon furcidens]
GREQEEHRVIRASWTQEGGIQNHMPNGDMLLQPSSMQPSSFTAGTSMRVMVSDGLCDTVQS